MNVRALHFDMKGWNPRPDYTLGFLPVLAGFGYNALLVEFEDRFPYDAFPAMRHPAGWTKEDFRSLNRRARELGIRVIPLLQCAGHLDYFLKYPEYRELRDEGSTYQWKFDTEETFGVWKTMTDELLEVFPDGEYFHVGADEAALRNQSHFTAYYRHVTRCVEYLRAKDRKVLLWDDVFRHHPWEETEALLRSVIPVVWQYREVNEELAAPFVRAGIEFWGASAVQNCYNFRGLPKIAGQFDNIDRWAEVNAKYPSAGHIGTLWGKVQCQYPISPTGLPQSVIGIAYLAKTLSGGKIQDRSLFFRELAADFFGAPGAPLEKMAENLCNEPDKAAPILNELRSKTAQHGEIPEIWEIFNEVDQVFAYADSCFGTNAGLLTGYRAGTIPPKITDNFLDGVRILRERVAELSPRLDSVLSKFFHPSLIQEFREQRFTALLEENDRWETVLRQAQARWNEKEQIRENPPKTEKAQCL